VRAGKASNGLTVAREFLYAKITAPISSIATPARGDVSRNSPSRVTRLDPEAGHFTLHISADFCRASLYVITVRFLRDRLARSRPPVWQVSGDMKNCTGDDMEKCTTSH
jgi:hypothetical protein